MPIQIPVWQRGSRLKIARVDGKSPKEGTYISHRCNGVLTYYDFPGETFVAMGDHLVETDHGDKYLVRCMTRSATVLVTIKDRVKIILEVPTERLPELDDACVNQSVFKLDGKEYFPTSATIETGNINRVS